MQRSSLPLQTGHPIADPRTGLLTPPWVIFFQQLIATVQQAALVPIDGGDFGGGGGGTLPPSVVLGAGYWTPITNGDPLSPEILFDSAGECIVGFVPTM
jgi:hypothetical protein